MDKTMVVGGQAKPGRRAAAILLVAYALAGCSAAQTPVPAAATASASAGSSAAPAGPTAGAATSALTAAPTPAPTAFKYAGTWANSGAMSTARDNPAAVRLADGRVLVAGGMDKDINDITSAEIFDPKAGTWSATGSLAARRSWLVRLNDGRVLAVGYTAGGELFDPKTGTWVPAGTTTALAGSAPLVLGDGRVFMVGGGGGLLFDPTSGSWSAAAKMSEARANPLEVLLGDGRVLVAGGKVSRPNAPYVATAEIFDPKAGSWTTTGSLPAAQYPATATALGDGRVLVVGGHGPSDIYVNLATAVLFDPKAGTWSATAPMATARTMHSATLLADGRVLVAGGWVNSNDASPVASAEIYDPKGGTWSTTGSLSSVRGSHAAVLLADGRLLVLGGEGASSASTVAVLASSELFR